MFLNGDRLVIFYNGQSDDEVIPQYDFVPRRSYSSVTHALIVDVSATYPKTDHLVNYS